MSDARDARAIGDPLPQPRTRVVVTGIGVVSPNAIGREAFARACAAGRSGIAAIRLIDRGLIDLKPLVSHVVPLNDYPALLNTAAGGDAKYIKGVVDLVNA